ncbi:MAG TPA: fasciclin domain-containing protein [Candidatus Corynebacterium faecigallinarum]|uniref:Fasciclin domain-containing protein n=1 Tax=Candidatus Corynebacterium faecigallinarum TaxID=2838528 RepID=A0A9D2QDV5_9CORY|nr:fasciclin domain-containing protein [Candidatus Corynebacterium faecigallinarum]
MKKQLALAATVSLTLALAACGDDNGDDAETTGTETTSASEATTTDDAATDDAAEGDIVDTAAAAGEFNTLITAVQAAELEETLRGEGPYTVLAPTDEAFEALPDGTLDDLLADPTGDLADILKYHVIEGAVMADDVAGMDGETVATVQGEELTIEVDGDNVSFVDATGNSSQVTMADVEATNGVIHALDGVLMPTGGEEDDMAGMSDQ